MSNDLILNILGTKGKQFCELPNRNLSKRCKLRRMYHRFSNPHFMELTIYTKYINSPLGALEISATEQYLTSVLFVDAQKKPSPRKVETDFVPKITEEHIIQVTEYFEGTRKEFDLKIQHEGTDFQKIVWEKLETIPYRKTISYLELSRRIGNEKAIRAVGTTNGSNKFNIIVPCHRVVGYDGSLVGYGGDLWRKKWLLAHEAKVLGNYQTSMF
jgi:methylated-DNA-[protein]-cysteine S-methyltransferase